MTIFKLSAFAGLRRKDPEKKKPAQHRASGARVALGIATAVLLSVLFSLHLLPDKVSLQVGDVSPEQIRAHRTIRYADSLETQRLRDEAAASADKVYNVVPKSSSAAVESVSNVFDILRRARTDPSLRSVQSRAGWVRRNLRSDLSDETLRTLLTADPASLAQMESYTERVIGEITDREIRDDTEDVQWSRDEFKRRAGNFFTSRSYVGATTDVANGVIRPNRLYDPAQTKKARDHERQAVQPRYRQIFLGEVVMDKGERVTPEHIDKFMALGLSLIHI